MRGRANHPIKVTAHIGSPVAPGMQGNLPPLDGLLQWSLTHHLTGSSYPQRSTPVKELDRVIIPTAKADIGPYSVPRTTDAIARVAGESREFVNRRFDSVVEPYLKDTELRKMDISSGRYKASRRPVRLLHVDQIVWFGYCSPREARHLLKPILNIGAYRKIGYGRVDKWEIETIEPADFSDLWPIVMFGEGSPILMRRIPLDAAAICTGWNPSFGAWLPPFWNSGRQTDIAIPC